MALATGVEVIGSISGRGLEVLSDEALAFVVALQRQFGGAREALLGNRVERQAQFEAGKLPGFLAETAQVRLGDWKVGPIPRDLLDRRVEITGPVDRKMIINALNSGAKVFMADFEDSCTPSWENLIEGQSNLKDAIEGTISYTHSTGRIYRLSGTSAVLMVRPRGWHMAERHVLVDGKPISASLFDFGLYLFHCARPLMKKGSGPYFYLPKLESHLEARLWNDLFVFAQEKLGLPRGTIKATVLIETILAAFEMDEILYELRDHVVGLNAGRWDYIYSIIKKFASRPEFILSDRNQITMTVPFMRAYAQLLVKTCHRRGAFAMGGMAAFIPSRKDPQVNEAALSRVRDDKVREAQDGFDGTWVAHPDLVPVAAAVFDAVLGERPNQVERQRPDVQVSALNLLDTRIPGGTITEAGLRNNIIVTILYMESWLQGNGAVAIHHLMEDVATAEICRSQVWQWIRHRVQLQEGEQVTPRLVRQIAGEELAKIRSAIGTETYHKGRYAQAYSLFEKVALAEEFTEFLTAAAYSQLLY
jgi:malate synthase